MAASSFYQQPTKFSVDWPHRLFLGTAVSEHMWCVANLCRHWEHRVSRTRCTCGSGTAPRRAQELPQESHCALIKNLCRCRDPQRSLPSRDIVQQQQMLQPLLRPTFSHPKLEFFLMRCIDTEIQHTNNSNSNTYWTISSPPVWSWK